LRFTLNGVDTHRTFAGRFMSDSYGSSVQHLAFATDDIFATAERLTENGFESLPIPDAYFIEIAAGFGLQPEFVARLRAANVLYDQDLRGGMYLQLYSRPYGDGFFFEVIERRGGYNARNAGYRTAAQKAAVSPSKAASFHGWP
jgi:4-hydroxyphenylpyruvate dioxygenase